MGPASASIFLALIFCISVLSNIYSSTAYRDGFVLPPIAEEEDQEPPSSPNHHHHQQQQLSLIERAAIFIFNISSYFSKSQSTPTLEEDTLIRRPRPCRIPPFNIHSSIYPTLIQEEEDYDYLIISN